MQKIGILRTTLLRRRIAALTVAACLSTALAASAQIAPSPGNLPFNGIAHIAIRVKDIAASVAFYNKLGYQQAFAMTKGEVVTQSFIKINDQQFIELYPVNAQTPGQDKPEFLHLCFEGVDLKSIHDAYVAEGLTPLDVRKAGAGNLLFTLKGPQQFAGPQNIEYTQYQPGSLHTNDIGQHLGPDRVGDKMTVVALAMQDPAAARAFYNDKLGFVPVSGGSRLAWRFGLPGKSGQSVEIVPVESLGSKSSIILESSNLDKVATQLTMQKIEFKRASASGSDGSGKTVTNDMIVVTDPDGNIVRIQSIH